MKALVLSFSPLSRDGRINRQIFFLEKEGIQVTAVGESPPFVACNRFISSNPIQKKGSSLLLRKAKKLLRLIRQDFEGIYWNNIHVKHVLSQIGTEQFDLVIANDWETLPLAACLPNARIVFDAHEYSPREFEDSWKWRLLRQPYIHYIMKRYLHNVDAMITVCSGIAAEYQREFQINSTVITNAPFSQPLKPQPTDPTRIRMIYHGVAGPSRSIEDAIEVMRLLDARFSLDMILIPGCEAYIRKIKKLAASNEKIRFIPPVDAQEIPTLCNQYDLGFFPLRPTNFNYRFALPNKFFEFLQARIPVVTSPLPEMARIINQYSCGVIARDYDPKTMAAQLNSLTTLEIDQMKKNADKAANEYNAEQNFKILRATLTSTLQIF